MAESFPTTLGAQLAKVRQGEAELHRTTIAAMDVVADDVAVRGDSGERGGLGSVEEFVFAIHGLNPHRSEGTAAKSYYDSIAQQFDEASWGRVFSLDTASIAASKQLRLHAIDGSDERAWRERENSEVPYSALRYVIERWDTDSNTSFIGKVVLPCVFSVEYALAEATPQSHVKRHDLTLKTYVRQAGGAAALFDVTSVIKPIPKIRWGLEAVEDLNRQDVAQIAGVASAFSFAQLRMYRHPDFVATPGMLDD